jgi:ankyrin repeat protein
MNPGLKALLEADEERYPKSLETKFKRIFDKIVELWGTPMLDDYFTSLLIDERGGRQGFPDDVMRDIFFLHGLHERVMRAKREQKEDVWSNEAVKKGLEREGIEYSPRGFFRALELGNERAISLFIQAGVDVELKNDIGWTPLMVTAFMGSEAGARLILEAGANVNARDSFGYGPMHWAAYQGFPGVIELLLARGANANAASDKGLTPLLQAAARGHLETVKLLLARGAYASLSDKQGWTPLHKAVANGHAEVVKALVAAGADREAKHESGVTPRDIARQKKRPEVIAALGG